MTANPMISMACAQAMLDNLTGNFTSGFINIYTGSIPATVETAVSGTLLSSGVTFGATAFGASTDPGSTGLATATANAITSDTDAANTGTAGYFRCFASNHTTALAQGTCGTSSADMIMNTTTINAGATVAVTSFVITLPDGSGAD